MYPSSITVSRVTGWQSTGSANAVQERAGIMQEEQRRFGTTLKQFRETRRVSQSKLAERAGFDHSYVSRLESGARTPTRDAVQQLSAAMELERVQQDELLAAAGFLPREVSSLLSGEPEITEVLGLLQNAQVPEAYRDSMRQVLRLLAEQARLVLKDGPATVAVA
jgi:transcriptional regulator with XRE-family HTH domain